MAAQAETAATERNGTEAISKPEEAVAVAVVESKVPVAVERWVPKLKARTITRNNATRHLALDSPGQKYIMSDNKKQERDFTPEVDALLPDAASLAKV